MVFISNESKGEYRLPIVVYLITLFLGSIEWVIVHSHNSYIKVIKNFKWMCQNVKILQFYWNKDKEFLKLKEPLEFQLHDLHTDSQWHPEANLNLSPVVPVEYSSGLFQFMH